MNTENMWQVKREHNLWTQNGNVIINPSGEVKVIVTDRRFARVICNLINSSPCWKLESTDENMDFRGIPR
jgi:hypothetical protein